MKRKIKTLLPGFFLSLIALIYCLTPARADYSNSGYIHPAPDSDGPGYIHSTAKKGVFAKMADFGKDLLSRLLS